VKSAVLGCAGLWHGRPGHARRYGRDARATKRLAEDFEGFVLWGGGEREVAGIGQHLPRLHNPVDFVLDRLFFFLFR